jgi:DNA-binding NarL/FixJ family response regulator
MAAGGTRRAIGLPSAPVRVMVVDDHARVRMGLRLFLSTCPDIDVVAEAGDGTTALELFAITCPDVVVMDLATPGMDCPVVTVRMKEIHPAGQIIALASEADPDMKRRALAAGARSYVLKDSSAGALVRAIYEAQPCAGAHNMTFVQAKTGASTERQSTAPSDTRCSVTEYDDVVSAFI